MNNKISDIISVTADKAEAALKENSVMGDPITVDGTMIIPVYKLSFGFGGGGIDSINSKNANALAGGAGAGVTKKPVSYITIKDGEISILSEDNQDSSFVSKILDAVKKKK